MRQRLVTILLLALVIAAGASYIVYRMVQVRIARSAVPVSNIVVAARNLEIGTMVKDSDLKTGDWTGILPKGMLTSPQAVVGRGVMSPIYEGEPVLESRLAPPGAGGGLAATIPAGMRACAVKVNDVVGLAGFVVPGMRVDVLISGNPPNGQSSGTRVKTLLQNIEVLSAGQNIQKDTEGKPVNVQVVNLLVTPEQAEVLSLASNETRIQLVLRNPLDTQVAKVTGSAMSALFNGPAAPPPPAAPAKPRVVKVNLPAPVAAKPEAPQVFVIEVFNGPHRSETKISPADDKKAPEAKQQ